jgi:hypothetical protein
MSPQPFCFLDPHKPRHQSRVLSPDIDHIGRLEPLPESGLLPIRRRAAIAAVVRAYWTSSMIGFVPSGRSCRPRYSTTRPR